jgi:hypothetical protein
MVFTLLNILLSKNWYFSRYYEHHYNRRQQRRGI